MRTALVVSALLLAFLPGGAAQQPPALAFHDFAAMPSYPFAGMQARGAMGQTASMFMADVPAGAKTTPHHHHQEQFMFGVDGAMKFVLAGSPQTLSRLTGSFAPPNVQHGNINDGGPARYIEFQPVLRPDWYPPHARRPREGTPEPMAIPAGLKVTEDFSATSAGWRSEPNARSKTLRGETAAIVVWELQPGARPIDLAAIEPAERFVYVLSGAPIINGDGAVRPLTREMVVVVPASATNVRISVGKEGPALFAVFEALKR